MTIEKQVKDIPSFEGLYSVSTDGKVFSTKRSGSSGKEIKQHVVHGYKQVWLSKENKIKKLSVHRAVLMAFDRLPSLHEVCNHKDGNKENNRLSNLEWCTREENELHKKLVLGEDGKGKKNGNYRYKKAKLYPNECLRNKLCELGVPRYHHNLAELGEMLPTFNIRYRMSKELYEDRDGKKKEMFRVRAYRLSPAKEGSKVGVGDKVFDLRDERESEARAKCLIYLLENKLITL